MQKAPNMNPSASQPAQGGQPAPSGAAAAGTPSAPSAAPTKGPFDSKTVSLADLGYPAPKAKPQAASATPPEGGQPAQPVANAQPPASEPGTEGGTQPEAGKPGEGEAQPPAGEFVAENGRKFKTVEDAGKLYNESSREAKRLAGEMRLKELAVTDLTGKLDEANKTLVTMQEFIANSAYTPNVPEKYKGMSESEMFAQMTEDEKLDYRLEKREWAKRVDSFKKQLEAAKGESEKAAQALRSSQERVWATMKATPAEFPGYEELEPTVKKVMDDTPELKNMPQGPYIAYFVALGDSYLTYLKNASAHTEESRKKAAAQAGAAAAAAGGGNPPANAGGAGSGAPKPKTDDFVDKTVGAFHKRNKVF